MEEKKEPPYIYGGNYGCIYRNAKHFNDIVFLGENYLNYKIQKIKIWSGEKDSNKIIKGIQVWYKNLLDGNIITPGEFKGDNQFLNADELEIKSNEYLNTFNIRVDNEVTQLELGTNKNNKISVGGTTGEEKYIPFNGGDNVFIFFYGSYEDALNSLGVGYIHKKDYMAIFFFGYFQLRYKLKNDEKFKKEWIEKENTLKEEDKALLKTCLLPDTSFNEIIKFVLI